VRRFVNIFVNGEDIRFLNHLTTPLKAGDELSIVPAIAGALTPDAPPCRPPAPPRASRRSPAEGPAAAPSVLDLVGKTPLVELRTCATAWPGRAPVCQARGLQPGGR